MSETDVIAVTGALGFVASHLFPRLAAREPRLIAILRPGRDGATLERTGVEVRRANLDDPSSFGGVFDGIGTLIHLSGMAQVTGMTPALESAGVRRGIFISSAGVHTKLVSASADRKRKGEATIHASSIDFTILRPSMIYGTSADRNIARLLLWIRSYPVVPVPGGGTTPQQPVHVDDLVEAIVGALDRPSSARQDYDIGGPQPHALREVIRFCGEALNRRVMTIPIPIGPTHRVVEWLVRFGLPTPVRPEQVLRLTESKAVDIESARRDLGFTPRPLADGIRAEVKDLPPP